MEDSTPIKRELESLTPPIAEATKELLSPLAKKMKEEPPDPEVDPLFIEERITDSFGRRENEKEVTGCNLETSGTPSTVKEIDVITPGGENQSVTTEPRPLQSQNVMSLHATQIILRPQEGLEPVMRMLRPTSNLEAKRLIRTYQGKPAGCTALLKDSSHCRLGYFLSPKGDDWRCLQCFREAGADWNFKNLHLVGLTKLLRTPDCPGSCTNNPFEIGHVTKCKDCCLVLYFNQDAIRQGNILKANPIV